VQAFWRVFFQLSMPGVAAAGLLVIIGSLGLLHQPGPARGPARDHAGPGHHHADPPVADWTFAGALATMLIGSALATCLIYDSCSSLSVSGGAPAHVGAIGASVSACRLLTMLAAFLLRHIGRARARAGRRRVRVGAADDAWTVIAVLLVPISLHSRASRARAFLPFRRRLEPALVRRISELTGLGHGHDSARLRSDRDGCITLAIAALAAFAIAALQQPRRKAPPSCCFMTPMIGQRCVPVPPARCAARIASPVRTSRDCLATLSYDGAVHRATT